MPESFWLLLWRAEVLAVLLLARHGNCYLESLFVVITKMVTTLYHQRGVLPCHGVLSLAIKELSPWNFESWHVAATLLLPTLGAEEPQPPPLLFCGRETSVATVKYLLGLSHISGCGHRGSGDDLHCERRSSSLPWRFPTVGVRVVLPYRWKRAHNWSTKLATLNQRFPPSWCFVKFYPSQSWEYWISC